MAEPQILNTLRNKREELEVQIIAYERKIEALRFDLAHVNATMRMFELNGAPEVFPVHMKLRTVFKRFEVSTLCRTALAGAPEGLDTRELALYVVKAKGLDEADMVLRKAVNYKVTVTLFQQYKRGRIGSAGMRKGVRIWQIKL